MKIHIEDRMPPTTTPCGRCAGSGELNVLRGHPGQDHRELPNGRRDIRWTPRHGPYECGACNGTGQRRNKPIVKGRWRITQDGAEPATKPNPYKRST